MCVSDSRLSIIRSKSRDKGLHYLRWAFEHLKKGRYREKEATFSSEMNDLFSPAAFIDHQISLLEQEKAYIEEHEARERDNYGDIYGSVTEMTQPQYGGVIVTFSIRSTGEQEGLGNPFKQGTPLAIEDVTNSHHFQGTVVVVRYNAIIEIIILHFVF